MRVLMGANTREDAGGVAGHITSLSHALERLGISVEHAWALPPRRSDRGALSTLRFAAFLDGTARRGDFDLVHAHGADGVLLTRHGPATVVTSHGDERAAWSSRLESEPVPLAHRVTAPTTRLPLFTRAIRRADLVIALHEGEAKRFRQERRSRPVAVIPNGCGPVEPASPLQGHVVFVGTWLHRKGAHLLPAIFSAILRRAPETRLTLVGPGPEALRAFLPEEQSRVAATTFLSSSGVDEVLARSDVLLLPSFFEGMPLAVLEALRFGIPVVGFDTPGTASAIGDAGLLAPVADVATTAELVVRLVRDRALRDDLSRRASERARRQTWQGVGESTARAYELAVTQKVTVGN